MAVTLLSLPYDARHAIYQQLFPPHDQIYIQAFAGQLRFISPGDGLALQLFLVCKDLSAEARAYLYNGYLFNIVGTKNDCLKAYKSFETILHRHARHPVRINAFSNGQHSATMCISMQAGDAKMDVLNRRRRGEARTIREMELEQSHQTEETSSTIFSHISIVAAFCAIFLAMLALALPRLGQSPLQYVLHERFYGAAGVAILPRAIVTVTSVRTNTVYEPPAVTTSTKIVPYTSTYTSTSFTLPHSSSADSINAGLNPVNGLPVPTSKGPGTDSSAAASINAGLNPINGLPVASAEGSKGASKPITPTSVQPPRSSKTSTSGDITITHLTFTTIKGTVSLRPHTSTSTRTVEPAPKPSSSKVSTHAPQLSAHHTSISSKKPESTTQSPISSFKPSSETPKPTSSVPTSSSSKMPETTSTSPKSSIKTQTSTETPKSSLDSSPFNTSTATKDPEPCSTTKGFCFPSESATVGNSEGMIGM
ncbi:hypothetical protein KC332_g6115 [Hortaea werneckii]|uniref:Uncharacterized protein n=2 Tax=Hortaea werneckii TaxID=91943 RepID=A0A1Z5SSP5_HORWE|nr:hypothetical protein KC350_g5213 [Hortaea werneckii]OTA23863.1 hypothetical protein BTJ68_13531 [Hortaea werneckii EXF-2000]KAI6846262.1 hypothetical protein KC358_g2919 [Hortaea werneckii]KAI6930871.1 hypothetical protein KC348_g7456 [Hortaea werneckii]KAI6939696.1 hypothetical protein KC341_g3983 [Hortaea werneckii]